MKKTVMIIGGGLLQIPLIQTAQKMGLQTIVTDYNPDAMGMRYADIPITMSTRDIDGSVRVAKEQNEITPIHAVLTAGTDASMTVAAVANALNLPGIKFEDAEAATNKIKMRSRFKKHNVPGPAFFSVWTLNEAKQASSELNFPVVIKPADNMGARGVMRVDNKNQVADSFYYAKSASPSGELIVEQYMEGDELSIDAIIYNGKITFTGIADRIIKYPPYFVEIGHTMPSQLSNEKIQAACDVMTQGIRALGIDHGYAKGDIKITKDGAKIGELAARLSGGFMSTHTFPYSSGIDLMKAAIEVALGQEPSNIEPLINMVAIERAIITEPGIVKSIDGIEEALKIPGIKDIFLNVKPGDKVVKPRSNVEKVGHIIAVGQTLQEAEVAIARCREVLKFTIDTEAELSLELIRSEARNKLKQVCYVCKSCDGRTCLSGVPGMGGIGTGASFYRNSESLKQYKILTKLIHNVSQPDTSTDFLGMKLSFPVIAAPITGTTTNMGGAMDEYEYNQAVIAGCRDAGIIAMAGDGASPEKYKIGTAAINECNGHGIAIFKPRTSNEDIFKRIKSAEEAGAKAVGIDIDAAVFRTMALKNQAVSAKDTKALKEIVSSTKLPFILKGIMNVKDAELAAEVGASAIVVSNHGGRVLDQMPGSADVLREIASVVKGKVTIMVDGGFRNGEDIIKGMALGADIILIGRPVAIAAVGMGARGVSYYLNSIRQELEHSMILTGCSNLAEIDYDLLRKV